MKLLTQALRKAFPPLYSQENVKDPLVVTKFFTPDAQATWLVLEFDGEDSFFGFVCLGDHEIAELGYFSLAELETTRGPRGLPLERDLWWTPLPLSEAKKGLCGGCHR